MTADPSDETRQLTEREPKCDRCGEVVHRVGHVWAHAEPTRIYGHVARVSGHFSAEATDA